MREEDMRINDFQDATAYVMAKTGCTKCQAEDALYDGVSVEETIDDYYTDYNNGDLKDQERADFQEQMNSRYENELSRIAERF